jgi:hypothetical protein
MNTMALLIFTSLIILSCGQNNLGTDTLIGNPFSEMIDAPDVGLSDSFDEDSFASWECVDKDNWDADGSGSTTDDCNSSFTIGGGQLTITSRGADVWGTTHEFNGFYKRDLTGDFDFSVQIVSFNTSPNAWAKFGFFMANDADDFNQGGYVMCAQTISNRVTFQRSSAGNGVINQSGSDSNNSTPKFLRLKKDGNIISCFFKENVGDTWSLHSQSPYVNSSVASVFDVGLIATSHNTSSELVVVMDDFEDLSL